jgi:hypothetical protein
MPDFSKSEASRNMKSLEIDGKTPDICLPSEVFKQLTRKMQLQQPQEQDQGSQQEQQQPLDQEYCPNNELEQQPQQQQNLQQRQKPQQNVQSVPKQQQELRIPSWVGDPEEDLAVSSTARTEQNLEQQQHLQQQQELRVPSWVGDPEEDLAVSFTARADQDLDQVEVGQFTWLKDKLELRDAIRQALFHFSFQTKFDFSCFSPYLKVKS